MMTVTEFCIVKRGSTCPSQSKDFSISVVGNMSTCVVFFVNAVVLGALNWFVGLACSDIFL